MNALLLWTALSILGEPASAFLPPASTAPRAATLPATCTDGKECRSRRRCSSSSRLHGISEWRDQALESKYTLESYTQQSNSPSSQSSSSGVPATIPILPFPFSDILLQGQRTQLNLYEQRFHKLFEDAMENHCGMVGMGLLAGNGMITTLPLCEVESFSRFGAEDDWVDRGDGMGNGSIFVTIRAVGRAKISEPDLLQEEPYMKARVVELLDDDMNMEGGGSGLKERSSGNVSGESTPFEIACLVAGNIENLMVSLASMEHRLKSMSMEDEKEKKGGEKTGKTAEDYISAAEGLGSGKAAGKVDATNEDGDEVMNRRLLNAQLESLFMQDSSEGVDVEDNADGESEEDEDEEDDDDSLEDETEDSPDRVAQFEEAFESAKETDTFGYVLQPSDANDNLSKNGSKQKARTPKDLTAISWACFCTGGQNDIQRDVMKIQALDMTNVLQRLQLGAAMLREEKKKWRAKLALAGIKDGGGEEEES